jgi:proteasome assembly chaperone (PAC2) family protein
MKNFLMTVNLSSDDIKSRIKNMKNIIVSLDKKITENISVVVITRCFMRLRNAPITMTMIIEEKEVNQCEMTLAMCSGYEEGFWIDSNAGKSMRNDLLKQLELHIVNMNDITPVELRNDVL